MTCSGSDGVCGGTWALSVFSPDGRVTQAAGSESQFELPGLAPGMSEIFVHPGGLLNTVVSVTTPLVMFPRQAMTEPSDAGAQVPSTPVHTTLSSVHQLTYGLPSPASSSVVVSVAKAALFESQNNVKVEISDVSNDRAGAQFTTA